MRRHAITAAALAAGVIAIYALRVDDAAGLVVDDAWYIVLAKALADGRGYRLISSATAEILPAVPPGFPALLAPVFMLDPAFPDNIVWLKLVSILAMSGLGIVCWIDFTRYRGVAGEDAPWLITAILVTPAFVFLATSTVMADCVFTFAQALTVLLVERAVREQGAADRGAVVAGVSAAAAMLIRSAGAAVIVAAFAYLLLLRRGRLAVVFGATVIVFVLPWQLYARAHAPTDDERFAHGGTIAYSYAQLLAMDRPGDVRSEPMPAARLADRIGRNLARVASRDVGAVFVPVLYRGPSESGQEVVAIGGAGVPFSMGGAGGTMFVSVVLSILALAGWLAPGAGRISLPGLLIVASLAMFSLVGSQTFRYVTALTPYLLLFVWRALKPRTVARIVLLTLLGLNLMDHALYIRLKMTGTPEWIADAREIETVLAWMSSNLSGAGPVASSNPGLVYLRTGRKGVAHAHADVNWRQWKAAGIRYVVALRRSELPAPSYKARLLFQTDRQRLWVVEM